jgi:uncharacterized protein DUF6113
VGEDENAPVSGYGVPETAGGAAGGETGREAGREAGEAAGGLPAVPPGESRGEGGGNGDGAPEPGGRPQAMVTGAAYGALAACGIVLGVVGSFLYSLELGSIPIAALAFVVVNLGAMRLAGWAMGSKLGAVIPTVTWLVVTFALSTKRAEGDLVITGTFPGYLFLIGGSISAMIAVALTPSQGSWLLRGANADVPAR